MGGCILESRTVGFIHRFYRIASHRIGRSDTWNALSFLFVLLVVMTSRDSIMESPSNRYVFY